MALQLNSKDWLLSQIKSNSLRSLCLQALTCSSLMPRDSHLSRQRIIRVVTRKSKQGYRIHCHSQIPNCNQRMPSSIVTLACRLEMASMVQWTWLYTKANFMLSKLSLKLVSIIQSVSSMSKTKNLSYKCSGNIQIISKEQTSPPTIIE